MAVPAAARRGRWRGHQFPDGGEHDLELPVIFRFRIIQPLCHFPVVPDQVRFYTGVPDSTDNAMWNGFWAAKLLAMSRQGVWTFSRPLRYRNQTVKLPDGASHAFLAAEEKGVCPASTILTCQRQLS